MLGIELLKDGTRCRQPDALSFTPCQLRGKLRLYLRREGVDDALDLRRTGHLV
jgi:hypothetical protein